MAAFQGAPKRGTFVGTIPFGNYREKFISVTTWGNGVYVHIKDRTKAKSVSLTSNDFFEVLQLKDKICSFLDKGAKIVAKQENEEAKQLEHERMQDRFEDQSESSDSEHDIHKLADKLNINTKKHVSAKSLHKSNLLDIKNKNKNKKHKKEKSSIIQIDSSDSDEEQTCYKKNKKVKYECAESDSEVSDVDVKPKYCKKRSHSKARESDIDSEEEKEYTKKAKKVIKYVESYSDEEQPKVSKKKKPKNNFYIDEIESSKMPKLKKATKKKCTTPVLVCSDSDREETSKIPYQVQVKAVQSKIKKQKANKKPKKKNLVKFDSVSSTSTAASTIVSEDSQKI